MNSTTLYVDSGRHHVRYCIGLMVVAAGVGTIPPHLAWGGSIWAALVTGGIVVGVFINQVHSQNRSYFEPIFISLFVFFGMYVTRPLALFLGDRPAYYKGYRMDQNYKTAMMLAGLGIMAFLLGYYAPRSRFYSNSENQPSEWDPVRALVVVAWFTLLSLMLYSVFVLQSGGIESVLAGRDPAQNAVYNRSSAYFWSAPQMLFPCGIIVFLLYLMKRNIILLIIAAMIQIPQIVLAVSKGTRVELLPVAFGYLACYYLYKRKNPPAILSFLALYLAVTIGLGFVEQIRIAGSDARRNWEDVLVGTATSPVQQVTSIFWEGNSNDMFQSLAIQLNVVPSVLPINPFDFTFRTIAKVVPSLIWPGKPDAPEEQIARVMFPGEVDRASSSPGLIGNSFQFGGPLGVMLVLYIFGYWARKVWCYYQQNPDDPRSVGLVSLSLGFIPVALRGAVGDTLSRMLFILVPFFVVSWYARVKAR